MFVHVGGNMKPGPNIFLSGTCLVFQVEPSALSPGLPTSQVSPVENQVSSWMEKVVERSSPHKPSQQSSVSGVSENVPNELKLNPDTLVQQYPKVDSPHAGMEEC